jgi:hypothetical protein
MLDFGIAIAVIATLIGVFVKIYEIKYTKENV